jgi:type II secretory pathway component PulC
MRYIGNLYRLLWCVNLLLLAVALCAGVYLFMSGKSSHDAPAAGTAGSASVLGFADEEGPTTRVDANLILERDLFAIGRSGTSQRPGEGQTAHVERHRPEPKRELPFRLVGTVVDAGGPSFALLENVTTKVQDLYRVGDVIGGVRIDRIEQNNVYVSSDGARHALALELTPSVPRAAATAVAQLPVPAPQQINVNTHEVVRVVSNTERQINTSPSVAGMEGMSRFLSNVRLTPRSGEDGPDGLRISGLGDSVLAQLAGVRDGDVIRSINGQRVSNQRKAAQVLQKARRLGSAQVELARGQESRFMTFRAGSW